MQIKTKKTILFSMVFLLSTFFIFQSKNVQAYDLPIGIPAPNLGSVLGNGIEAEIPANPVSWPSSETVGYYYIDNTNPSATDSNNSYGYPNKPRLSIPTTLAAGSVVEVHGGPYAGHKTFTSNGTEAQPVFIYGIGSPLLAGGTTDLRVTLNGSNFVYDGIDVEGGRIGTGIIENAVIRNSDVDGNSTDLQLGVVVSGKNIVVYNNDIHHHQGDDKHGMHVSAGSDGVWILNNKLHHNGGDGIQFCHGCSSNPPRNVYIGKNEAYGNRENGFDFKYGENIVLSQNIAYNHHAIAADVEFCYDDGSGCTIGSSGSDGASIVVGSDGATTDIWLLYNTVYNSGNGIRIEEAWRGYAIGNIIYDVDTYGIQFEKAGEGPNTIAYNTIHNAPICIGGPWQGGALVTYLTNNILSGCSNYWIQYNQELSGINVSIDNNLFYNGGASGVIKKYSSTQTHTTGATIDAQVAGSGNVVGNPNFANTANGDYSIFSTSAARDVGSSALLTYNADFQALFGSNVSILYDFIKTSRPQGSALDIGAYEYVSIQTPVESCSDNIQNQNETEIDCGGVCDACDSDPDPTPITYNLSNLISAIDNWLGIGNETSDVNSDSVVNTRDLGIMMSSWGN